MTTQDIADALSDNSGGVVISVEVTAGAKTDRFPHGYNPWRTSIGCRVAAPAVEGRANKAVIHLIADTLLVPATTVSVMAGSTSSQKKILIHGRSKSEILERLVPLFNKNE